MLRNIFVTYFTSMFRFSVLPKNVKKFWFSDIFSWGPLVWDGLNFNTLSTNPTKWSNTLKQFVGNLSTNCLSVFDYFVGLALKGIKSQTPLSLISTVGEKHLMLWLRNCVTFSFYLLPTFLQNFMVRDAINCHELFFSGVNIMQRYILCKLSTLFVLDITCLILHQL